MVIDELTMRLNVAPTLAPTDVELFDWLFERFSERLDRVEVTARVGEIEHRTAFVLRATPSQEPTDG